MAPSNTAAQQFKSLHIPGSPLVLANVYDALTASTVGNLPSCKALATASAAVANAAGLDDDDLDLATNMHAVRAIGKMAKKLGLPLTADLQDGYGDQLEDAITQAILAGAVGANIEDGERRASTLVPAEQMVERIRQVLDVAARNGVPDFVVNARCDVLLEGGNDLEEVIRRGQMYLDAGATSVFVLGGSSRGVSRDEVVKLVEAFQGRLNVSVKFPVGSGLTVEEVAKIGVCRISAGPRLQEAAMKAYADEAAGLLR